MSGRYEPYTLCLRDQHALNSFLRSDEGKRKLNERRDRYDQEILELYRKHGITPKRERELEKVKELYGYKPTPLELVNNPAFVVDLRELVCKQFSEIMGRDPLPYKPVTPYEMMDRNWANMEWSSTALYYVPSPEEDVILCLSEVVGNFHDEHYRGKNTHEYICSRIGSSGASEEEIEVKNAPWHEVVFEYDRDRRNQVVKEVTDRKLEWARRELKAAIEDLSHLWYRMFDQSMLQYIKCSKEPPTEKEIKKTIRRVMLLYHQVESSDKWMGQ